MTPLRSAQPTPDMIQADAGVLAIGEGRASGLQVGVPVIISGVHRDGTRLAYPFIRTDAGKHLSRAYTRQRNDCTVRALATAFGLPYDVAHDLLSDYGRKTGKGCHFKDYMTDMHPSMVSATYPAKPGQRRTNPASFSALHPVGTYIVSTAHHVITVRAGVFYDIEPPNVDRCIYRAWRID